jgi:hypothetical protein
MTWLKKKEVMVDFFGGYSNGFRSEHAWLAKERLLASASLLLPSPGLDAAGIGAGG